MLLHHFGPGHPGRGRIHSMDAMDAHLWAPLSGRKVFFGYTLDLESDKNTPSKRTLHIPLDELCHVCLSFDFEAHSACFVLSFVLLLCCIVGHMLRSWPALFEIFVTVPCVIAFTFVRIP